MSFKHIQNIVAVGYLLALVAMFIPGCDSPSPSQVSRQEEHEELNMMLDDEYDKAYEKGYWDGISDGMYELEREKESAFFDGHYEGYNEGYFDALYDLSELLGANAPAVFDCVLNGLPSQQKKAYAAGYEDGLTNATSHKGQFQERYQKFYSIGYTHGEYELWETP